MDFQMNLSPNDWDPRRVKYKHSEPLEFTNPQHFCLNICLIMIQNRSFVALTSISIRRGLAVIGQGPLNNLLLANSLLFLAIY